MKTLPYIGGAIAVMATIFEATEWVMVALSVSMLVVCLWSWRKENDYVAAGYVLPALYFVIFYLVVSVCECDPAAQSLFGRVGVAIFMVDTIIWRGVYIRRRQRQRYAEY